MSVLEPAIVLVGLDSTRPSVLALSPQRYRRTADATTLFKHANASRPSVCLSAPIKSVSVSEKLQKKSQARFFGQVAALQVAGRRNSLGTHKQGQAGQNCQPSYSAGPQLLILVLSTAFIRYFLMNSVYFEAEIRR